MIQSNWLQLLFTLESWELNKSITGFLTYTRTFSEKHKYVTSRLSNKAKHTFMDPATPLKYTLNTYTIYAPEICTRKFIAVY